MPVVPGSVGCLWFLVDIDACGSRECRVPVVPRSVAACGSRECRCLWFQGV